MKKNNETAISTTESTDIISLTVNAYSGKETELKIYNAELIKHTNNIFKFEKIGKASIVAIAFEIAQIDEKELYKSAGFDSIAKYCEAVFDYSKATTSAYNAIAKKFVKSVDVQSGRVVMNDGLPNFSVGQLIELRNVDVEDIKTALQNGDINPYSSSKVLRKWAKGLKAIDTTATEETAEENDKNNGELFKGSGLQKFDANKVEKPLEYAKEITLAMSTLADNLVQALDAINANNTTFANGRKIATELSEILAELNR